ncbi:MAG TPA: bifunctional diguanylate cyclase/phosphodiesterase, partial [Actinomycetota bacterium]|nr:bifunctional diguanylate cyclase/phosphodiesterase [Actinomycetota bacterium]
ARQAIRYSATWPTAATVSGLTFRVGVLSVIGLLAGLMVRNLQRERLQVELRAAQLVGLAAEKEHLALHDVVTGLPNRVLFQEEVAGALGTASADGTRVAVMIMDLDRFREINDTLGHHNGDAVLQLIAARLEGNAPQSAVVARLGGDEFGVLLANVRDPGAAAAAGRAILGLLETPVCIDGFSLHVEASVGVAVYPEHGEDADQLLQRADVAMYVTKAAQSGVELYSAKKDGYRPSRLTLMGELRRAIDGGELVLYYQPQVHVRGERVHSVEALVRWQHPVRGLIPPDEFIPLAERTGLIRPLTQRVVELAVQQWAEWRRQGRSLRVAANLSARNLHDPGLADEIARLVWKYKVPPGQLELEITESALMGDTARALDLLPKLRAMGIRLAIDDFGTGYSSLAYLKQMPVSQIKIDRSFVRHMSEDAADTAIVGGTVDLAHNLGLEVVAEGVEDRATFNMLAALGCDVVQGWLVAPALPAADLVSWLDRREQANDSAG